MNTSEYRVLEDDDGDYSVVEVYYDENGEYVNMCRVDEIGVLTYYPTVALLAEQARRIDRAFTQPVVTKAELES